MDDKNDKLLEENVPQNSHLTLAYYKGNVVVMRRIHKKTIDLSRTIRNELIQVRLIYSTIVKFAESWKKINPFFLKIRELRHENLVQIIGACVDPGNVFILMEYYTRGSLQDVLMNFDIKLDQMFITSLVADILRVSIVNLSTTRTYLPLQFNKSISRVWSTSIKVSSITMEIFALAIV